MFGWRNRREVEIKISPTDDIPGCRTASVDFSGFLGALWDIATVWRASRSSSKCLPGIQPIIVETGKERECFEYLNVTVSNGSRYKQ